MSDSVMADAGQKYFDCGCLGTVHLQVRGSKGKKSPLRTRTTAEILHHYVMTRNEAKLSHLRWFDAIGRASGLGMPAVRLPRVEIFYLDDGNSVSLCAWMVRMTASACE